MDFIQLQQFLDLADSLHFGVTSQRCNISPSALSRSIQRMEDELGDALFVRDNRSVSLTPTGIKFRRYANQILDNWEEFKFSVVENRDILSGEISIYSSVTACYSVLPDIIEKMRAKYPEVHLKIQTGDAADSIRRVRENGVDVAVAMDSDEIPESLLFKSVTETPLVFVTAKGRGYQIPKDPKDWSKVPLILPERGVARQRAQAWFAQLDVEPNIYAQVAGNEAIIAMVNLGCGIGIVPRLVLEKSPIAAQLEILNVEPGLAPYVVGFVIQSGRLKNPLVNAFWSLL